MKDYFILNDSKDCTGCRVCEQICPVQCIQMKEDPEGFAYPFINDKACVRCGKCKALCPVLFVETKQEKLNSPVVYAAQNRNVNELRRSASGGIFSVFARNILQGGGIISGCALVRLSPLHIIIDHEEDLDQLRGSKYVESDIGHIYGLIKEKLEMDTKVLFSGTGCQVAGLKAFLGKDYPNLISIDLICHGVPSRKLFAAHTAYLQRRAGKPLTGYRFRSKERTQGALGYEYEYEYDYEYEYGLSYEDVYYSNFLKGTTYRESCYRCRFASLNREGDITIGDYLGIGKFHVNFEQKKGVSVLIVNTDKGLRALKECTNKLVLEPSKLEWASGENKQLRKPTVRPPERDTVFHHIETVHYDNWAQEYYKSWNYRKAKYKTVIKRIMPEKMLMRLRQIRDEIKD